MQNQYETTLILTPVLSSEESRTAISGYVDFMKKNGCEIIEEDHWGMKQMAYPIKKKTTGIYHFMEYKAPASIIDRLELALRRDENILRFLTIKVEKYAAIYNDNKRKGLVGRNKKKTKEETAADTTTTEETKEA